MYVCETFTCTIGCQEAQKTPDENAPPLITFLDLLCRDLQMLANSVLPDFHQEIEP